VLLTAGPTSEAIDPVRVITNVSSGKMGYAIARAAAEAGAEVCLVSGPTALPAPYGVQRIDVMSARDMLQAVQSQLARTDIFIAVAAVADWRVKATSSSKIKKTDGALPSLELETNPDILATIASGETPPYCVGFAAETDDLSRNAHEKRLRKRVPLLVGNLAQNVLGADDTEMLLFDDDGQHPIPLMSKQAAARRLVAEIARRQPR